MTYTPTQGVSELFSPFLPTTYNYPEDPERFKSFLTEKLANFADVINDKSIGVITQAAENFDGRKYGYLTTKLTRNGYQTLAFIPSLPNTTTLTLTLTSSPTYPIKEVDPHFVVAQVWGSASKPCSAIGAGDGDYFSFYGSGNPKVSFTMSDTAIVITTTTNMTAYSCLLFIQYIREGI